MFIVNLRGLPANLERLRIDRQVEKTLTAAGDPLHLTAVFGIAETTAIRYATNARHLLNGDHGATLKCLPTQVSDPDTDAINTWVPARRRFSFPEPKEFASNPVR